VLRAPPGTRKTANILSNRRKKFLAWLTLFGWFAIGPASVFAATNSATGSIGDGTLVGGDGTGTAQFEINSVRLALIKEARDSAGAVLAAGADVRINQEIYFV
jgi:hypothetical protein